METQADRSMKSSPHAVLHRSVTEGWNGIVALFATNLCHDFFELWTRTLSKSTRGWDYLLLSPLKLGIVDHPGGDSGSRIGRICVLSGKAFG
jgi:hypothetical protein